MLGETLGFLIWDRSVKLRMSAPPVHTTRYAQHPSPVQYRLPLVQALQHATG
jgi:hypothetical protein